MKRAVRQTVFWLGGAVILVLAVPTAVLYALIWGVSTLICRTAKMD